MEIYNELLKVIPKENILIDEPMKNHTSFKIGGKADFFVIAKTIDEVKAVLELVKKEDIKLTVIGNGTNLLVKDGGIRGITLKLDFKKISKEKNVYTVGASVPMILVSKKAEEDGLSGLEFACGIPGTIGGAVRMNAGAYGGEMKDVVVQTTYVDYNGNIHTIGHNEHEFDYRSSVFKKINGIIVETKLSMKEGKREQIKEKMTEILNSRREKQPIDLPSAGSTFKRGNGFITSKLIDDAGLKGMSLGGAQISTKHAGFVVNNNNATAKDVLELIDKVKKILKEEFNVEVEEEIIVVGEDK